MEVGVPRRGGGGRLSYEEVYMFHTPLLSEGMFYYVLIFLYDYADKLGKDRICETARQPPNEYD